METKKNIRRKKIVIEIDSSLTMYTDMELFQEKVNKANKMLRTVGLPKDRKKKNIS